MASIPNKRLPVDLVYLPNTTSLARSDSIEEFQPI